MTQHTAELRVRAVPQHSMVSLADFVVQGKAPVQPHADANICTVCLVSNVAYQCSYMCP